MTDSTNNLRTLRDGERIERGARIIVPIGTAAVLGETPQTGWVYARSGGPDVDGTICVPDRDGNSTWVDARHIRLRNSSRSLLTKGDRVHIDAQGEKHDGMEGTITKVDEPDTALPYFVEFDGVAAEWFASDQVRLVDVPPRTTVATNIEITVQLPALAGHIVDALAHIPDHFMIGITTHDDHIRIVAEHEETDD